MAISDTDVLIQFILRSVNESGPGIAAAQAQLAQLEVQTRATGTALVESGNAASANAVETAVAGTAAATAGTEARGSATAFNEFKTAMLGAGAASERNVGGLLALGASSAGVLTTILALGAGLEYFAIKSSVQFQSSMEMIRTQAGASQKEVESMTQALLTMASQVGTGPEALAQALFHIESSGLRASAALTLLRSAAELAKVGHADLTDVTNALVAVTNSHIAGIKSETDASAQLNAIIGVSNLHMQDLVASFKTGILPTAAAAGLALRDVGAAMAVLSINGVPAELGMTRLRTTISLMEAPTSKAQKALESIGISSTQLGNDMRKPDGLLVALTDLKTHLDDAGLTASQQAAVIYGAFGQRSASAVLTLIDNIDTLGKKYQDQESDAKKYASEVEAEQKTAAHQWDVLSAKAQVYFDIVGKASLPAFTGLLHTLNDLTGALDATGSALDRLNTEGQKMQAWQDNASHVMNNFLGVLLNYAPGFDTSSVSAEHLATSTDHVSAATIKLKENLIAEAGIHGQVGSATETHRAKVDSLTASYDRLIAASKAYTASAAHEGQSGIGAATSQLQSAIAPLAPDFRAALQPVLDGFISQLSSARADYFSKVRDSDASYQASLLSLHNTFLANSAGKDAAHVAALKQTYEESVTKLGQEHDRSLANEKAAFDSHVKGIEAAMRKQGDPGAIFASAMAGLTQKAQDDLNRLSYALATGKGNVDQLSAAAIRAALSVQHGADISTAADLRVALGMGDLSRATADYQKQLAEATSKLAGGILGGDSKDKLEKLTAAGAKYEVSILHISKANDDAAMRIARASGDFGTYLSDYQKKLQDVLSNAEGRFISDQQSGNTGALPGDRAAVDEARTKLQHLTNTVNELDGKLKTASDFSSQSAAASDRASKALGAYALALEEKKPDAQLESLRQKAQAAADEADKYTKAQALATAELARSSHDVVVRMDAVKQSLTDTLQRAIDQGASDLRLHGAETNKDREAIARASKNLDVYNEEIAKVTPGAKQLVTSFAELDTAAKTRATSALDALALAELKHTGLIGQLTDRAALAAEIQANTDQVMVNATLQVAKSLGDFKSILDATNTVITNLTNKAAGLVYTGQTNAPTTNLTPQQIREERIAGKTNTAEPVLPTEYKQTIDQLVGAEKEHLKQEQALATVNYQVYVRTGEFGNALQIVTQKLSTETSNALAQATLGIGNWQGALDRAAKDNEAQQQRSTAANNAYTDSEIRAAVKAGDLSTAFTLLSSQITGNVNTAWGALVAGIYTGTGDLGALTQGYLQAKQRQDELTAATYQAYILTGQYSSALGLVSQKLSGDFSNAVDKVTLDLLNHSGDLQADTAAAQAARSSSEALTTAQWNSSYATGSATAKMQMLESSVQGVISNFNSMQSANAAVSTAAAGVTSAQATIQISLLQNIVTNTQDMTAVLSASAGVARAVGNEQLVAVRDQAGIITSQGALDAAMLAEKLNPTPGNLAAIAVARDQLQISHDTAVADFQAAVWLAQIARDNLVIAQDKLASDRANEAAQAIVDQDKLRVAVDTEHLAVDQMKLTADTLPPLLTIASAFADVSSYQAKIDSDLQSIGADQQQIGSDNQQLASDTSAAAMVVQQGLLQQALDSQKLAADQAASDASSQAGQLKIAQDGIQLAKDQVTLSAATAANTAQTNNLLQKQLDDMTVQRDSLASAFKAAVEGIYNPSVSDLDRMLTGYTAEAHAAGTGGL